MSNQKITIEKLKNGCLKIFIYKDDKLDEGYITDDIETIKNIIFNQNEKCRADQKENLEKKASQF